VCSIVLLAGVTADVIAGLNSFLSKKKPEREETEWKVQKCSVIFSLLPLTQFMYSITAAMS
jgi:hypothetical protein